MELSPEERAARIQEMRQDMIRKNEMTRKDRMQRMDRRWEEASPEKRKAFCDKVKEKCATEGGFVCDTVSVRCAGQ